MGDYSGAIADSSQVIYLKPNNAQAYFNRGITRV
ncbi:MAG: tetratricopeptide repeat protein [Okeania sp. SIO2F4]|nr:tetratricopeptide repeat protein [Okeania sp. SIO2F4]